ncbi:DHHA1 domain-containing protein [Fusibacter bizertensis]|uniref:DHHA1 domain-containing protein n=1 Tax=Fusibacter bizertensis TaxID=1488331 RepID=A0ABT6ND91_9FIRM|nr:DHHA1 domain-containing protein [Fusibacter bizertensis]MDH8678389.1 DHHA1 domain-containing protein [Fusibacter bizertensis]
MTIKSFLNDAYTHQFNAKVTSIEQENQLYKIQLDHTFFYPEGGGQPCDHGNIEMLEIADVQIDQEDIFHISKDCPKFKVGENVTCKIDFSRRFTLMQQHTGQHILSSCAEKLYEANTIGFHIGADYVTIDLDQKLTQDQIVKIENSANQVIYSNKEVIAHYPTAEELANMPLRKQPKVTENIRVIEIVESDFSPCGGTHVKTTSEVGIIKIKKTEPYKSGIRIEFGCGGFALKFIQERNETINSLMKLFSVKDNEILNFTEQLLESQKNDRANLQALKEQLYKTQVAQILEQFDSEEIKVITLTETDMSMTDLRLKCNILCEAENIIVLAVSSEGEKTHLVLSKSKNVSQEFNMGQLFKSEIAPFGVKGGGNPFVAQGGSSDAVNIDEIMATLEDKIQKMF